LHTIQYFNFIDSHS